MQLNLYNTLSKRLEPFTPRVPLKISFYTCGPTVYDDAHIGNFRSFLAADLLRRWINTRLYKPDSNQHYPQSKGIGKSTDCVVQVMNITDVGHMTEDNNADGAGEDKMEVAARRIKEAKKMGNIPYDEGVEENDAFAIARYYEQRFKEDAIALGMKVAIDAQQDPSLMPRATDNIEQMKQVIEDLIERGYAYASGDAGSRAIYFNIQKFQTYGKLSGNTLENLRGGAGGRVDDTQQSQKKHPADFLLWKEDENHKMKWPSPRVPSPDGTPEIWGQGYPGWHIECTAMALNRLIPGGLSAAQEQHAHIDLHSGGEDNIFPHHECEIAQSCCFTSSESFATHWFHPRFLKVDGQKMSKSKGTMHTLRDLTAKGFDPAAVRLELIKTHYRVNADFSIQGLKDSARTAQRWKRFIEAGKQGEQGQINTAVRDAVAKSMDDDLNIAGAIGTINKWIKDTPQPTQGDAHLMEYFDEFLYVCALINDEPAQTDTGIALYQPGVEPSPEIESLLAQRRDAKKDKDFAAADAIRDQLAAMGLSIMDKPGGKVEVAISN